MENKFKKKPVDCPFVHDLSIVSSKSLMHYHKGEKEFIRIYTGIPAYVKQLRGILETGIMVPGVGQRQFLTYESNILFVLRCMIDSKITGANWYNMFARDIF